MSEASVATRFDRQLIARYDQAGPRYTSYPTANRFHSDYTEASYRKDIALSNQDFIPRPLSLYLHIPFCDTVCYYCACNKIVTKHHDRAADYVTHLRNEIALQAAFYDRDRMVDQLHWGGGTPTFLSDKEIASLFEEMHHQYSFANDEDGEFAIEIDPRTVDAKRIKQLRAFGLNRISLGVQDFDPDVQKAVNRIQGEKQTLEVIDAARNNGFRSLNVDLIYGLPLQTLSSIEKTLTKVIEARPERIALYNYAHLPERFKPQRRIHVTELPSASNKLNILQLAVDQLSAAGYVYIGMDHFALPSDELAIAQQQGDLKRNFQGYSTHAECDVIAMGITAIGETCDSYHQNTAELETYYQQIDEGKIPIVRGLRLNDDDKLRRAIINQLMCDFSLSITNLESRFNINFKDYFKSQQALLEALQHDGLLHQTHSKIEVLPAGRFLIRNIAMVFDNYLSHSEATVQFSKVI